VFVLTLAPLEYAVRRSLGKRRTLEEMASRSWIIEPAHAQRVRAAVYLEQTLARATAAGPFSSLADQYQLIAAREVQHLPIRAHLLKGAALVGASIYVRGFRAPLAPEGGFRSRQLLAPVHLARGALGCTYFGNMFFGHFWTDDVPLMQLGAEFGQVVRTARPLTEHQRALLELVELRARLAGSVTFDELLVLDDRAQTRHKARRYRAIRQRFAERYRREGAPHGVFLFRGATGSARVLVNEAEIAAALEPYGFVAVHPERLSFDQLNQRIWGARWIVGVEGSQLLHGFYNAAEGARFLVLNPPMRFSNVIKSYTDCLDMHYGFVIGEPCTGGFRVELGEVLRVMDMLEARASQQSG
jgi:capsular polysaccharide biosynthesis protein